MTFLFTLTQVPIEAVSMKLFTGIENFEIMAIPFFILAGNFLTHGGVARRMINFAISLIGHLHGGLGLAGIVACSMFALVCGSSVATVAAVGAIVLPEMVRNGYPMRFGAGIITVAGSLGILMLPSIPKIIYAVSTAHRSARCSWPAFCPHPADHHAVRGDLVSGQAAQLSAHDEGDWVETVHAFRESIWGLMLSSSSSAASIAACSPRPRPPPWRPFIRSSSRSSCTRRSNSRTCRGPAARRQHQRDAALYRDQRGAVFVRAQQREHPAALADWIITQDLGWSASCCSSTSCCCWPAISWSRPRSS